MQSYTYTGYLWPSFVSTVLVASLGWYAWRRRRMPGALPFAIGCLFAVLWSLGAILEMAADDPGAKISWLRFQTLWQLPVVTSAAFFGLEYSGLTPRLPRRLVVLLALPALLLAALIVTDGLHHLAWTRFSLDEGNVIPVRGPATALGLAYSSVLSLFNVAVLAWLFLGSPRHRWPAALMVLGQLGSRALYELRLRDDFPAHWDADPFVLVFVFGLYAVALFRFRVFDPLPVARAAVVQQMRDGIFVLDLQGRIVDANPAAERTVGRAATKLRGSRVEEILQLGRPLGPVEAGGEPGESDLDLQSNGETRHYTLEMTPLQDGHGRLGQLLLLHDVTEKKRAQERLLEQERVLATLQERERLARELHDGTGQVLGYLSLQAQGVRKWLQRGEGERADSLLARLAEVAQGAHREVRESIFALAAASSHDWSFLPTLERYLEECGSNHELQMELVLGDGVTDETFDPASAVQLLRVIQEAVTNSCRHAGACKVQVIIEQRGDHAHISVSDDGRGFEPGGVRGERDGHFGLAFMRERMAQIGGSVQVESRPSGGTRVNLETPAHTEQREVVG